ncbi:MAG TPA: hypothetical protein PKV62_01050 [Oscillospiraceae bacterium]|nr:hypothetical protein [Oscillospiraceae bacterium]
MSFFVPGIVLEQRKEPMLSRDMVMMKPDSLRTFQNPFEEILPQELRPEEITEIARLADIIDESDGRSLYEKLTEADKRGVDAVIADAIDDEPYISSQLNIALHEPEKMAPRSDSARRPFMPTCRRFMSRFTATSSTSPSAFRKNSRASR